VVVAFLDEDPVEEYLGKRVEKMTPDELVTYVKTYLRASYDLVLPVDGKKERAVFQGLHRVYGRETAGRIVKWVFWKYEGRYQSRHVGFFDFTKGMRWFTDRMFSEMHDHMQQIAYHKPCPKIQIANLEDL
jgi:hypothetical protein